MIEIGLTAAALILITAVMMIIKRRRDQARADRHRQLEEQAAIQRERHRQEAARQRIQAERRTTKPTTLDTLTAGPTVFDLRNNAKSYTPRHQARDVTHTRTPGTDLGVTTNPALLYGATGGFNDPTPSSSSSSSDCGSSSSSSISSSSSSYDSGGSSSCDSGGGSF